jgi:hypothetical protein
MKDIHMRLYERAEESRMYQTMLRSEHQAKECPFQPTMSRGKH